MESSTTAEELLAKIKEFDRRQGFETRVLRTMQFGAVAFMAELDNQCSIIESEIEHLSRLQKNKANYSTQLVELQYHRDRIAEHKLQAAKIAEMFPLDKIPTFSTEEASEIQANFIDPLLRSEGERKFRALRIQGAMVSKLSKTGERCQGRRATALADFAKFIDKATSNQRSVLSEMWRWLVRDKYSDSIWLYYHHASDKWKCLFFRITIDADLEEVKFWLETYVPYGVGGDPAQYSMETSDVYTRPSWRAANVTSRSYSSSNTYNLAATKSSTEGSSVGESVTNSQTESESWSASQSRGRQDNYSSGESWSLGGNSNWNLTSGSGGGTNTGSSQTSGGADSSGTSTGKQTNVNSSNSIALSEGIALTSGNAFQISCKSYGINLGLHPKEHLEQWRHFNGDAAEILDRVHSLFETMCRQEIKVLQGYNSGPGTLSDEDDEKCIAEIAKVFPIEDNLSALQGQKNAAQYSSVVQPLEKPESSEA